MSCNLQASEAILILVMSLKQLPHIRRISSIITLIIFILFYFILVKNLWLKYKFCTCSICLQRFVSLLTYNCLHTMCRNGYDASQYQILRSNPKYSWFIVIIRKVKENYRKTSLILFHLLTYLHTPFLYVPLRTLVPLTTFSHSSLIRYHVVTFHSTKHSLSESCIVSTY
jgi:hypothetical protein